MTAACDEHLRWLVGVEAGDGRAKPTFCRAFGKENAICQTN